MFRMSNKLDSNLKQLIKEDYYDNYRVLICCNSLLDKTSERIVILKGEILYKLNYSNIIAACLNKNSILRLIEYPSVSFVALDEVISMPPYAVNSSGPVSLDSNPSSTGKGVNIGIIDTGVYPHKDLTFPNNRIIGFKDIVKEYKFPYDDSGHGTITSGIISSSGCSSKFRNKGIAPESNIYMIKAFNNNNKSHLSNILYSFEYLINISKDYDIKIILLPFNINNTFIIGIFSSLFKTAADLGIMVIVTSGENGSFKDNISGFALLNSCLTIGGYDSYSNNIYNDSSGGNLRIKKPDFIAPCSHLLSLNCGLRYIPERNGKRLYPEPLRDPYSTFSGISLSSAYAAGLTARLFEKNKSLNAEDIKSLLKASCQILNLPKYIQGEGYLK